MNFNTKILPLLMAMLLWVSCSESPEPFHYDREVIAVFPPEGIEAHSFSGLVYEGLYEAAVSERVLFRPVLPTTYEEGLLRIEQTATYDKNEVKRLIVVVDPTYADDMVSRGIADKVMDTKSTQVVVLGAKIAHPNIYNAHIPPYGMMYKAGYIAAKMNDVESVNLFVASGSHSYYKEAIDGFTHGYKRGGEKSLKIDDVEKIIFEDRIGFNFSQEAYSIYAPNYAKSCDLLLPLCRESAMGFYTYNREYPGKFYTLGVDNDMSIYADDVPFSCVSHWKDVAASVLTDWNNNRLEHQRKYGLEEAKTAIVVAERYKSIVQPLSDEIHDEAIQREFEYLR